MAKSESILVGGIPLKAYLGKKKSEEAKGHLQDAIRETRRIIRKIGGRLKLGDHCKYDQTPGPVRHLTDAEILKEYGEMPARKGLDSVRRTLVALYTMTRDGSWITNPELAEKLKLDSGSVSAITARISRRLREEIEEEKIEGKGRKLRRRLKPTCSLTQEAFIEKFYKRAPKKVKKKKKRKEAPPQLALDPMKLIQGAVEEINSLRSEVDEAIGKMDQINLQAQSLYERSEQILQDALDTPISTGTDLNLNLGGETKVRIFVHFIMGSKE